MKEVVSFQLQCMAGILVITLVSGLVPLKLANLPDNLRATVLGLLNFYSGGVFLGAGMLHMLPDAVEAVGDSLGDFPFVYLVSCAGFILVWVIDNSNLGGNEAVAVSAKSQTAGGGSICYVDIEPVSSYGAAVGDVTRSYGSTAVGSTGADGRGRSASTPETAPLMSNGNKPTNTVRKPPMMHKDSCSDVYAHGGGHSSSGSDQGPSRLVAVSSCDHGDLEAGAGSGAGHAHPHPSLHTHEHTDVHHHVVFSGDSLLPFLLAFLFSVHSFLAGLALGVQHEVDGGAVAIVIAILAHKVVEAVAVTSSFVKEQVAIRTALPVILVYCFMTPLGVAAGMLFNTLMSDSSSSSSHSSDLIQAFASGSFVFLANHAMEDSAGFGVGLRLTMVAIGLGSMALLAVWM